MQALSADELLNVINKQWATTNDIMSIGSVGYHRALKIRKTIAEEIGTERLPKYLVPMEFVVDYFNINVSYLKKVGKSNSNRKEH